MTDELDLLVVGSGIAGLTAAVRAVAAGRRVGVVTKGAIDQTATGWAQGGVAAVLGGVAEDTTDRHLEDTLRAGAGLCDADAVRVLVDEGPVRVRELIELGAQFDRDPDGTLQLGLEGGHSFARVVHAGGAATGREIERALVEATRRHAVSVDEYVVAADLVVRDGRCRGVTVRRGDERRDIRAANVLLASGGAGQLFALTTNPLEATGDGVAIALRAGAAVADVEFVQFHPTALAVDRFPRPLLTEALRGEGAVLRNLAGERFTDELAPRDIVARAITAMAASDGRDHVWLDATSISHFAEHFPSLAAVLAGIGLDPAQDWLPVAPAAHYLCGGVLTDLDGATSLPGLWAAGEVACSGINGANRLASNSLLEGLVFGARVVDAVVAGGPRPGPTGALRSLGDGLAVALPPASAAAPDDARSAAERRRALQRVMTADVGVVRDAASLRDAATTVAGLVRPGDDAELVNLATLARAVCAAASTRHESRGGHHRADFPARDDAAFGRRIVFGGPAA